MYLQDAYEEEQQIVSLYVLPAEIFPNPVDNPETS